MPHVVDNDGQWYRAIASWKRIYVLSAMNYFCHQVTIRLQLRHQQRENQVTAVHLSLRSSGPRATPRNLFERFREYPAD
jgi:hypothetical protein